MKTNRLSHLTLLILFFAILTWPHEIVAQTSQYVTLLAGDTLPVQTNQIVSVVGYDWSDGFLNVNLSNVGLTADLATGKQIRINPYCWSATSSSGSQVVAASQIPQIVTGVTNIYFIGMQNAWATIQITTPASANVVSNYVPADAIVIPASASGDVQIILESSTDLVNWTAANPGTYGASSATNRFFRVRAVHN